MKDFKKYQHLERWGTTETQGIEIGECYIFPKIDGTNSSLWWDNGLQAGKRTAQLTTNKDNRDFYNTCLKDDRYEKFFKKYPNVRLYGEWLVKHTLKTYEDSAWNKFYVFDVANIEEDDNRYYIPYEEYKPMLEEFSIEYIPTICVVRNPTYERVNSLLSQSTFLVKDGLGLGEGVVVKNYEYKNRYGRQIWAKLVRNEFKSKHSKNETRIVTEKKMVEEEIVNKYVSLTLVDKEFEKIKTECDGWSSKLIPRLLSTVYYCLVKEESWNFVKEHKNPTINYKTLLTLTVQKIKGLKPEIF